MIKLSDKIITHINDLSSKEWSVYIILNKYILDKEIPAEKVSTLSTQSESELETTLSKLIEKNLISVRKAGKLIKIADLLINREATVRVNKADVRFNIYNNIINSNIVENKDKLVINRNISGRQLLESDHHTLVTKKYLKTLKKINTRSRTKRSIFILDHFVTVMLDLYDDIQLNPKWRQIQMSIIKRLLKEYSYSIED